MSPLSDWSQVAATPVMTPRSDEADSTDWDAVVAEPAPESALHEPQPDDHALPEPQLQPTKLGRPTRGDQILDRMMLINPSPVPQPLPPPRLEPRKLNTRLPCIDVAKGFWNRLTQPHTTLVTLPLFFGLLTEVQQASASYTSPDESIEHMSSKQLLTDTVPLNSKVQTAELANTSRKKLDNFSDCLASCVIHVGHWLWATLDKHVLDRVTSQGRHAYVSQALYDETPMTLRSFGASEKAKSFLTLETKMPAIAASSASTDTVVIRQRNPWNPASNEKAATSAEACKIVQLETCSAILIEPEAGHFIGIVASFPNHLSLVERCTARCLMAVNFMHACASPAANSYAQRLRMPTTDNASANNLCEKTIAGHGLRFNWKLWHEISGVHIVASIYGHLFRLFRPTFRGVLHNALSLKIGAHMNLFRKALREEIAARGIRVVQGSPPKRAQDHRIRMIRVFCSSGGNVLSRQMLLALLPNGEWDSLVLKLYVGSASLTPMQALSVFTNGIIYALVGINFKIVNQGRWLRNEDATDQCGLLEAVHMLGSGTYRRYMRLSSQKGAAAKPTSRDAEGAADGDDDPEASVGLALEDAPLGQASANDGAGFGANAKDDKPESYAERNAKSNRLASEFWIARPLPSLCLTRLCMEPVRVLMAAKYAMFSEEWLAIENRKLAGAMQGNGEPLVRDFRATVIARCDHEEDCLKRVEALLGESELWAIMPREGVTVSMRCLGFRALNRIKCCVAELLVAPQKKMPMPLFLLLVDPHVVAKLRSIPTCMLDSFSRDFLAKHAANLLAKMPIAFLTFLAYLWTSDTVTIEKRNAMIRRFCLFGQTLGQIDIMCLSRLFLFMRVRRLAVHLRGPRVEERKPKAPIVSSRKRKRAGGGGGQRAYISEQLTEKRLRLTTEGVAKQLNDEYNALPPDRKATYAERGRVATARRKESGSSCRPVFSSFGKVRSRRDARAKAETRLRFAVADRSKGMSLDEVALTLADRDALCSNPCDAAAWMRSFKTARKWTALEGKGRAATLKASCAALVDWRKGDGAMNLRELQRVLKLPQYLQELLTPVPAVGVNMFTFDVAPGDMIKRFGAFVYEHASAKDVKKALCEDFRRRHYTHLHDESPPVPKGESTSSYGPDHMCTPCWAAGLCICSVAGKVVARVRNSFMVGFKLVFPHMSDARRVLAKDGFVVAHLVSFRRPRLGDDLRDPGAKEIIASERWWHIGLLYLSPLRPTYDTCTLVSRDPADDMRDHPERVLLASERGEALTEYHAFDSLPLDVRWEVVFYTLEDNARPLGSFNPGQVAALRFKPPNPISFWGKPPPDDPADEPEDDAPWGLDLEAGGDDADKEPPSDDVDDALIEHEADLDILVADPEPEEGAMPPDSGAGEPAVTHGVGSSSGGAAGPSASPPPVPGLPADVVVEAAVLGEDAVPPPPGPIPGDARRGRMAAALNIEVLGGSLQFYEHDHRFQAICSNELHGACVLTRHARLRSHMKGRPAAFLSSWLDVGRLLTREEHWEMIALLEDDVDTLRAHHESLEASPEGRQLLAKQRPLRDGEVDVY
jgi:hypothetical protein